MFNAETLQSHMSQKKFSAAASLVETSYITRNGLLPLKSHDRGENSLIRRRSSVICEEGLNAPTSNEYFKYSTTISSLKSNGFSYTTKPLPSHTDEMLGAVIKVNATICEPRYRLPWQMRTEYTSICTAFSIGDKRLLTVAHGVLHNTVIRVKKRSTDEYFIARVLCMSSVLDIALLTVDDESFWIDISALTLGSLPALQDAVSLVGFPSSGDNVCITSGVASRIEMKNNYLTIQIDAALNSGNSGGPALGSENTVVGMAFMKQGSAENQGVLIATNVIHHFLRDYERNGEYSGSCVCGFDWQTLQDEDFRRYLKMNKEDSGILVIGVRKMSPGYEVFQKDDVVLSIDNVSISNAGKVAHLSGERLPFTSLIVDKFPGDEINLDILRSGKRLSVNYKLCKHTFNTIIPRVKDGLKPKYFVVGGLVMVALTNHYICDRYGSDGREWPWDIVHILREEQRLMEDGLEEIILLSKVLNHKINIEYAHIMDQRVIQVNSEKVLSLRHLKKIVDECQSEFIRFDLDSEVVVLDRQKAMKVNEALKEIHGIPSMSRLTDEVGYIENVI